MATQKLDLHPEVYVSTDIETDGPIPGPHSMLSLGSVAFDATGIELASFTRNLVELEGAAGHPETMAWWAERPEAFKATRTNVIAPTEAMAEYVAWFESLPGVPIFVGYPASWDFMFVYWYLLQFAKKSPFGHSAVDIRSYAMGALDRPFQQTTMKYLPRSGVAAKTQLTHVAEDDARIQGRVFVDLLRRRSTRGL